MKRAKVIYEEKSILTAKYYHPKSDDYLDYISIIKIKDLGKNPIEMAVKFDGILPFVGIMHHPKSIRLELHPYWSYT